MRRASETTIIETKVADRDINLPFLGMETLYDKRP